MSLAKTKKQVVDYATVNIQLREALQALFDECVIADMLGELSEAVTGETLDKVREALKAAEQLRALDLPNEPLCVCGKPLSKHQGVVCLPESASQ
jgi:hypothetical protein